MLHSHFYRPANPRRIRTDSKHSLRLFDMSFFLVTRLLNSLICLISPAIPLDCTASRIRSGFLPTYERFAFIPTRKWLCYFCRQRTKFAAFTLSFMHRQQIKFAALRTFRCTLALPNGIKSDRRNSCRFFAV